MAALKSYYTMDMDRLTPKGRSLHRLEQAMLGSKTYDEWLSHAIEHDKTTDAWKWRRNDESELFDYLSIRSRLDNLRKLRANHDDQGLLFALNEGVHGNMGGMGKPVLYTRAKSGTKKLIEDYIDEICDALNYLANPLLETIPYDRRFEFFHRASHCYGRSALMLSGGGALGNFHLGVIKVLLEKKMLPNVISGASAGAFIAAIVGTHKSDELLGMYNDGSLLAGISMGAGKFKFKLSKGELMGLDEVATGIARVVPDLTFQQAYEKTGRSINISISGEEKHQSSRLLNHIASPNVTIRSAVMASCAVPGVFPPVMLHAKNESGEEVPYLPSRRWVDGSFSQDLPAKRLSRMYGVNHFIVSQVNPAVLPLLSDPSLQKGVGGAIMKFSRSLSKEMLRGSLDFMQRQMHLGARTNLVLDTVHALVDQEYTGDINIFPNFRYFNPRKIISAISEEEIQYFLQEGERSTWPKVAAIDYTTRIGRTLDAILGDIERHERHWLRTAPKSVLRAGA
ncbi:MAG: DUF3336 domain-containing protein [Pseudomonadales bacterium]|nr:DUF3336 domain-containing protein [Pseudomonadales bacterium]